MLKSDRRWVLTFFALFTLSVAVSMAVAFPDLTGYSGAPGSNGNCASTCHGSSGGTITATGFPTDYTPNQLYMVTIAHSGGNSIRNFNGSVRIGEGTSNAGIIASGTNTSTYNSTGETNGVHFTSENQNSGTFEWTAPSGGTGSVKLYISGLQGSYSGLNSILTISSQEQGGFVCGDADGNGSVNILDITFIIAFLYQDGPAPAPPESADVDSSGSINILDITYIIAFLYQQGPSPNCP